MLKYKCKNIRREKVEVLQLIVLLIFIIISLIIFAVMQIRSAGMKIKDFVDFIQANQVLDSLYEVTKSADSVFNGSGKSILSIW